ncbi:hypothetical protein [Nocardioides montaniterrae]
MENTFDSYVNGGIAVLPCAASAAATLEVRVGAVREVPAAAVAARPWAVAFTGMKRAAIATAHTQGSLAWSPPL